MLRTTASLVLLVAISALFINLSSQVKIGRRPQTQQRQTNSGGQPQRQMSSKGRQMSSGGWQQEQVSSRGRPMSSGGWQQEQVSSRGRPMSSGGRPMSSGGWQQEQVSSRGRPMSSGGWQQEQVSSGGRPMSSGGRKQGQMSYGGRQQQQQMHSGDWQSEDMHDGHWQSEDMHDGTDDDWQSQDMPSRDWHHQETYSGRRQPARGQQSRKQTKTINCATLQVIPYCTQKCSRKLQFTRGFVDDNKHCRCYNRDDTFYYVDEQHMEPYESTDEFCEDHGINEECHETCQHEIGWQQGYCFQHGVCQCLNLSKQNLYYLKDACY